MTVKIEISKKFYDSFIKFGGKLPEQMKIIENNEDGDIVSIIRNAFNPSIIVEYIDEEDAAKEYSLC